MDTGGWHNYITFTGPNRSIELCHFSSWSMHSDRIFNLFPGDIDVASVDSNTLHRDFSKKGLSAW